MDYKNLLYQSFMLDNDKKLIEMAKANKEDFKLLYDKYENKIYNYFWHRVGYNSEVAEDLMQETFVRAYSHLPNFKKTNFSYASYLYKIAHNLLINYYRSPRALPLKFPENVPSPLSSFFTVRKEKGEALLRALQQLSKTERDVILLKYQNRLKAKEIAKIIGKSENAVKLILSRARKKIAKNPDLSAIENFVPKGRKETKPRFMG